MKAILQPQFSILAAALAACTQLSTLNPHPASAQSPLPDSFNPRANARVLSLAVQAGAIYHIMDREVAHQGLTTAHKPPSPGS
jgi:hypothetical protein